MTVNHRIKFVPRLASFSGSPYASFPSLILFIKNVIFLASVRIVCLPSSSFSASPGAAPWMLFQYWLDATGIPEMVKYLFSSSNVAEHPPRLAQARNMTFLMKSIALGKEQFGFPEKEAKIPTNFIR